jgi:Phosphotransferase enzyme family
MSRVGAVQEASATTTQAVTLDRYRVVLLRNRGSEVLVAGTRPAFTLPAVEVPSHERVAEHTTLALKAGYGIDAICLFETEVQAQGVETQIRCQAMEVTVPTCEVPPDTAWFSAETLFGQSFADAKDLDALTTVFQQLSEFQSAKARGPFGKPEWIRELLSWIETKIACYGLCLTGRIRQLNASPTFALIRLETNGTAMWFKAVGEPNLREFPVSVALSALFPGFVPTVIATHEAWNGWLTMEFSGTSLSECQDSGIWELAAKNLAHLQIESAGKIVLLLEAGCRDMRLPTLFALVDPFIESMSDLMRQQQKTPPAILDDATLQDLGNDIKRALGAMAELGIPDTLGHLDFNPGNILCSRDQCIFLDWAEAFVGSPFLTLEYLREHCARLESTNGRELRSAYREEWLCTLSQEAISSAFEVAPLLAVFAYAAGLAAWQNQSTLKDRSAAGYLRSLTRRMHAESIRLQERSLECRG